MVEKQISSGNNYYCYVQADKPILVVQFCQSQQSDNEQSDPMMMMIPPIKQYGADYTFATPKYSLGSYINYFIFVVRKDEKSGLRMDGSAFPSNTGYTDIPGTNPVLVGGYIKVSEGSHTVRHTSPISIFGGYLYGRAPYETYGFPAGMRMAPINSICRNTTTVTGDGLDNDCDGLIDEELCTTENQGQDDDGDGQAEEDCAKPVPIDGAWTAWGSYSACSQTCKPFRSSAMGTQTKIRTCTNPEPKYGGKQCSGTGNETISCSSSLTCPIYTGCYTDASERILSSDMTVDKKMTVSKCMQFCKKKYYAYAGVEYSEECFCGGNLATKKMPDTDCNVPCGGNETEKCGGIWRISVYYMVDERWEGLVSPGC